MLAMMMTNTNQSTYKWKQGKKMLKLKTTRTEKQRLLEYKNKNRNVCGIYLFKLRQTAIATKQPFFAFVR